jgi:hypothetical protein
MSASTRYRPNFCGPGYYAKGQQETAKTNALSESTAANSALNDGDDYVRVNFGRRPSHDMSPSFE